MGYIRNLNGTNFLIKFLVEASQETNLHFAMNKSKHLLFLYFFISLTFIAQAQQNGVVLRSIWENEANDDFKRYKALDEFYELTNQQFPDSALNALNYHIGMATAKMNSREMFSALKRRGNIMRLQQNYSEAMSSYTKAELIAKKLSDSLLIADICGNIGNVYMYLKDYITATRRFSTALKIYQRFGKVEGETRMLTNLGSVFLTIHNYDLSLEYYTKVLASMNKRKINDRSTGVVYMNMGWTYYEQKKFELACDHYLKALALLEKEKSMFFVADCYSNLSLIYHELKDITKALEYVRKSKELNKTLGAKQGEIGARVAEAKILYDYSPVKALSIAESLIDEVGNEKGYLIKKMLYEVLYKCYKQLNRPIQALAMHELFAAYEDSVFLEINQFEVIQEAFKWDNEVQITQRELKNQQEKDQLKTTQFRNIILLLLIFFLVAGALIYVMVSNNATNKMKRMALLQEIEILKKSASNGLKISMDTLPLDRVAIEKYINRSINETDWKVLNILLNDPSISNNEIAKLAYMSLDGIGSSLRRMYEYFELKDTKYKKIALIIKVINICKEQMPDTEGQTKLS
jgi:tetratricopeptide (TPR) repeat protein